METPMTKLTDTQLVILGAAAKRDDRNLLPLPGSLRGGAATKVVAALLARGLVAETVTDAVTKADAALNRIWRNDEDGRAILLHLTDAGLATLGLDPEPAHSAPAGAAGAPGAVAAPEDSTEAQPAPKRATRTGTKQATLIAMLRSESGATIGEIMGATGWQSHTVRGALAGALKKRLGLEATSEKHEVRGRVYRLPPA
jgi:hypothetical protein